MNNINISPKHGLNPTMPVCFWCKREKKDVVLLGKLPGDAEAPRHCVLNYEPCDTCKEKWSVGVVVFEVTTTNPHEVPPMRSGKRDFYPTGNYMVLKPEASKEPALPQGSRSIMLTEEFQEFCEEAH